MVKALQYQFLLACVLAVIQLAACDDVPLEAEVNLQKRKISPITESLVREAAYGKGATHGRKVDAIYGRYPVGQYEARTTTGQARPTETDDKGKKDPSIKLKTEEPVDTAEHHIKLTKEEQEEWEKAQNGYLSEMPHIPNFEGHPVPHNYQPALHSGSGIDNVAQSVWIQDRMRRMMKDELSPEEVASRERLRELEEHEIAMIKKEEEKELKMHGLHEVSEKEDHQHELLQSDPQKKEQDRTSEEENGNHVLAPDESNPPNLPNRHLASKNSNDHKSDSLTGQARKQQEGHRPHETTPESQKGVEQQARSGDASSPSANDETDFNTYLAYRLHRHKADLPQEPFDSVASQAADLRAYKELLAKGHRDEQLFWSEPDRKGKGVVDSRPAPSAPPLPDQGRHTELRTSIWSHPHLYNAPNDQRAPSWRYTSDTPIFSAMRFSPGMQPSRQSSWRRQGGQRVYKRTRPTAVPYYRDNSAHSMQSDAYGFKRKSGWANAPKDWSPLSPSSSDEKQGK